MFPITRMAATATKLERKSIKVLTKGAIPYGDKGKKAIEEILNTTRTTLNKTVEPYSKNPFKRMVTWIKTFFENYKLIKNSIKTKTESLKEEYGKLFTKKRQKMVKQTIIKSVKEKLLTVKEMIKEMQNEFKNNFQTTNKN